MEYVRLEHVIYAPVPYKGYSIRAKSRGADVESLLNAFKGWLIPFDQTIVTSSFLERVVVCGKKKAYIARVFQASALDELRRSGVVSHVAELDLSLFEKVPLSLVDSAMAEFVERNGVPVGELEPLTVTPGVGEDAELSLIRNAVPREAVQRMGEATRGGRFKIFVLYKGADRESLAFGLARVVLPGLFRGEFIVASENVKSDVLLLYDGALIVGGRLPPWARVKGWDIINLQRYAGEPGKPDRSIEEVLRKIYG